MPFSHFVFTTYLGLFGAVCKINHSIETYEQIPRKVHSIKGHEWNFLVCIFLTNAKITKVALESSKNGKMFGKK